MRIVLLFSCLLLLPLPLDAQTPAAPPATPPAGQARPRAAAPARTAIVVTVTDPTGATLPGIQVDLLGASERSDTTNESGAVRLANVRAGTHRLRFSGPGVIAFEREVFVRAGQTADLDVTLHPAPQDATPEQPDVPEPAAAAPAGEAPPLGPVGEPAVLSILDLLEKDFVGRQPRKETMLGCSGNSRAMMIQLNDPLPERLYESADATYYVLGGEGTVRLNGRESALVTGSFALVPRGASHAFVRKGRRPLILLFSLNGEPCPPAP